jgi:hypothetical protein
MRKWVDGKGSNSLQFLLFIGHIRVLLFGFFERRNLDGAFEHNKILWFIASLASLMTAFYMFRLSLLSSKNSEVRQNKKSFT